MFPNKGQDTQRYIKKREFLQVISGAPSNTPALSSCSVKETDEGRARVIEHTEPGSHLLIQRVCVLVEVEVELFVVLPQTRALLSLRNSEYDW